MINLTVFQKSPAHVLRSISLATFPPAFLFLLVAGINLRQVNPAIGLVPLAFSSAYAAILLANEKKCGCQAGGLTGTPFHFILDFVIGTGLLICIVLGWIFMGVLHYRPGGIILGTYGTVFLICNL